MQYNRRTLAVGLLAGVLVLTAGCSGILGEDTTQQLKLVNQDNTDHAVVVEISDDTGVVYTEGRTIDAESNLDLTQFDGTGEYEVTVAVDGNTTMALHTFEAGGNPPPTTNIGIDNQATVTVE